MLGYLAELNSALIFENATINTDLTQQSVLSLYRSAIAYVYYQDSYSLAKHKLPCSIACLSEVPSYFKQIIETSLFPNIINCGLTQGNQIIGL